MNRRNFFKALGAAGIVVPTSTLAIADKDLDIEIAESDLSVIVENSASDSELDLRQLDNFELRGENNFAIGRYIGTRERLQGRIERYLSFSILIPEEEEFENFFDLCRNHNTVFSVMDGDITFGRYRIVSAQACGQLEDFLGIGEVKEHYHFADLNLEVQVEMVKVS